MKLNTYKYYEEACEKLDFALFQIAKDLIEKCEHLNDDQLSNVYDHASDEINILLDHKERFFHLMHLFDQASIDLLKKELIS